MNLVVFGAGYVGLVTSVCLAEKGNNVICIDNNSEKVQKLITGNPLIYEERLEKLLKKNLKNKRLNFVDSIENISTKIDAIFVCVGTPEKADGIVELKYVYEALNEIIKMVNNDVVVAIKSTVPIGECDKIETYINDRKTKKIKVEVVSSPEFLSQGTAINDFLENQRIIIGANTKFSKEIMKKIYNGFKQTKLITTRKNAEMIKYASNSFLALKISYVNSIADLCEKLGTDINIVSTGMGLDERIGRNFLNAGIGYGGSCFPKDTKALLKIAEENNICLDLVKDTILINERQKFKLIKMSRKNLKSFDGVNVAILGLTFKPNTNDLRESLAIENIKILLKEKANVTVYDPVIKKEEFGKLYRNVKFEETIEDTIKNKDVCFIFTEWKEIKKFDVSKYKELMKTALIYDGRNCYEKEIMEKNKIKYFSIGR